MENENDKTIVYQNMPNQMDSIKKLVSDDSPLGVQNEFWSPLGIDIPLADMREEDFKKVRLMTDLLFLYKQREVPQQYWDQMKVHETFTQNGETRHITQSYNSLWPALTLKIFLKMKRAVDALNLKQFTENRTLSTSILEERNQQQKKKKWGLI